MLGGALLAETGAKLYDWRIEKEIQNDSGNANNENIVVMNISDALPNKVQNIGFMMKSSEFQKFHSSLTALRAKTL
jgi:hypothetical protein